MRRDSVPIDFLLEKDVRLEGGVRNAKGWRVKNIVYQNLALLRSGGTSLPVQLLFKKCTRLEGEDLAGGDGDGFAGLGVAHPPIALLVDREFTET